MLGYISELTLIIQTLLGFLVLSKVEAVGQGGGGGGTECHLPFNSCYLYKANFQGSALVEGSWRTVVGLALWVAFFPIWSWIC